jgi:Derlin-2/3
MSSPGEFYNSLPPVSKAYGTLCFLTTVAYQLKLINPAWLYLDFALVTKKYQIWRLLTNFFFLGGFSIQFGVRLLMIARYGVQLEQGPFARRTADFLWMMIVSMITCLIVSLTIPFFYSPFMGGSLVFMLLYMWSREFPSSKVSLMGLVSLQGFWLPWALLVVNTMFGAPLMSDLLGIVVGHAYYFLAVLHPRASGQNYLKTPAWVHNLVGKWSAAGPAVFSPPPETPAAAAVHGVRSAFTGRSYRLNQ